MAKERAQKYKDAQALLSRATNKTQTLLFTEKKQLRTGRTGPVRQGCEQTPRGAKLDFESSVEDEK